jgi:hypothetical protein
MELEHPDLEPFEPVLREVIAIAFVPPYPYPQSALLLLAQPRSEDRDRQFIANSFAAYGALQLVVASHVAGMSDRCGPIGYRRDLPLWPISARRGCLPHRLRQGPRSGRRLRPQGDRGHRRTAGLA